MKIKLLLFFLFTLAVSAQEKTAIFFDFNKDMPNETALVEFHSWLAKNPDIEVLALNGYCDSIDDTDYNNDLSQRRINSVLNLLKDKNIAVRASVALKPFGKQFGHSGKNAENRRVDLFYRQIGERKKPSSEETTTIVPERLSLESKKQIGAGRKGDLIPIDNIHFYLNSEIVVPESETVLDDLYDMMERHPELRIEIHGHICCNSNPNDTKLSYRRAMYIFNYLRESGIAMNRLGYKGFGSANPIYRIPEKNATERLANRRVEILIVGRIKNRI